MLVNGEKVDIRRAELIKDDPDLVFRCGPTEYRFNWKLVLYYVIRKDRFEDQGG